MGRLAELAATEMGAFRHDRETVQMGVAESRRWNRKSSHRNREGETVLGWIRF